jgi:hypothetical protein
MNVEDILEISPESDVLVDLEEILEIIPGGLFSFQVFLKRTFLKQ